MPSQYPSDVLKQAQEVLDAWRQIGVDLSIGELTQTLLATKLTTAQTFDPRLNTLEAQMTDLRNQRDATYTAIWDTVKRVRGGVKAIYGDDSSQYEVIGGIRRSERKKATRKPKATP